VLPAILMILGFLVAAAVAQERIREERQPGQVAELLDLIRARREAIASLAAETQSLSRRLQQVRTAAGQESAELRAALEQIDRAKARAGVAPAAGSGVVVEVADSRDVPRTRGDVTDLRIQDVDLRLIVNALWRAGAEAVAVNGRRVISTTAIRAAGDTILVNFSPVSSPYVVDAVGDPAMLRSRLAESEIARQFGVWEQVYGLGFQIRSAAEVSVPGLGADAELSWATPVGEG
jgi:uncharacterized protein YlxW (UPF0749 family)